MKILKCRKQIMACLFGMFMLFGVGGVTTEPPLDESSPFPEPLSEEPPSDEPSDELSEPVSDELSEPPSEELLDESTLPVDCDEPSDEVLSVVPQLATAKHIPKHKIKINNFFIAFSFYQLKGTRGNSFSL